MVGHYVDTLVRENSGWKFQRRVRLPRHAVRGARPGDVTSSLTDHERAILDAIAARLIPTDDSGPGAREAGVVRYVEQALATDYQDRRAAYSAGLAALDASCGLDAWSEVSSA